MKNIIIGSGVVIILLLGVLLYFNKFGEQKAAAGNVITENHDKSFDELEIAIWKYIMDKNVVESAQVLIARQDEEYIVNIVTKVDRELDSEFVDEVRTYVVSMLQEVKDENIRWTSYWDENRTVE